MGQRRGLGILPGLVVLSYLGGLVPAVLYP